MAYCKTKTYLNLKRVADRAWANAMESRTQADWDHFTDLELDVADYAYINEADIDWDQVNDTHGHTK